MAQFRARKMQCDGTIGDINGDGRCDWNDYVMMIEITLEDTCHPFNPNYLGHSICCTADISGAGSGGVNIQDRAILGNWLSNHCSDLEDSDTCDGSCPGETIPPIRGGRESCITNGQYCNDAEGWNCCSGYCKQDTTQPSTGGGICQVSPRRRGPTTMARGGRVRRQQGGNGNGLPKPWNGK